VYTAVKDIGRKTEIGVKVRSNDGDDVMVVSELTYHPDCGEVFLPTEATPFIAVLALPGDDVKPGDLRGFYFDGTVGVQAFPNVWHQGMYVIDGAAKFHGKQGMLHCCVKVYLEEEFGRKACFKMVKPKH